MHKYKLRQVPRFFGTNWCAIVVPIQVIRWYRQCYNGTDSCAIVVQIRRYCHYRLSCLQRCISFESYIKPQRNRHIEKTFLLYIFWILHQTTTCPYNPTSGCRCISFESYIKPQLSEGFLDSRKCCISFESYIKPQRERCPGTYRWVVYLLNPTSNHNSSHGWSMLTRLYIFWILHQTTTSSAPTTHRRQLYIFWILHQTTTLLELLLFPCCCISFESYIKPQLCPRWWMPSHVVYLLNPTSNHNIRLSREVGDSVVYLLNPTSNHNCG